MMNDQCIDSRDIQERIDELEIEQHNFEESADQPDATWETAYPDEAKELSELLQLKQDVEEYNSEWKYGVALIRDDYFTEYCQDMVEDIGDLPRDVPSYIVIDWEATADNLKMDYTEVDFDGHTYLVRTT